jgi:hypothetical protein
MRPIISHVQTGCVLLLALALTGSAQAQNIPRAGTGSLAGTQATAPHLAGVRRLPSLRRLPVSYELPAARQERVLQLLESNRDTCEQIASAAETQCCQITCDQACVDAATSFLDGCQTTYGRGVTALGLHPPTVTGLGAATVHAGERLRITGSGFRVGMRPVTVTLGGPLPDGSVAEGVVRVHAISDSVIDVEIPPLLGSGTAAAPVTGPVGVTTSMGIAASAQGLTIAPNAPLAPAPVVPPADGARAVRGCAFRTAVSGVRATDVVWMSGQGAPYLPVDQGDGWVSFAPADVGSVGFPSVFLQVLRNTPQGMASSGWLPVRFPPGGMVDPGAALIAPQTPLGFATPTTAPGSWVTFPLSKPWPNPCGDGRVLWRASFGRGATTHVVPAGSGDFAGYTSTRAASGCEFAGPALDAIRCMLPAQIPSVAGARAEFLTVSLATEIGDDYAVQVIGAPIIRF